ncbi:MAG: hypothetical protein GKR87_06150 [Kiritimatiellae bacterium]|nr:hypothetical protein [Kiritimatiellia bacterium]
MGSLVSTKPDRPLPGPRGHRQALYSGKQLKALAQLVGKHPDATLEELKNMSGVKGSIMAVQRALNRLGSLQPAVSRNYLKRSHKRSKRFLPTR